MNIQNKDLINFIELLGENNVKKIQDTVTDMIIDSIEDSLNNEWIILPDEANKAIADLCKSIINDIKKKYKDQLTDAIENKLISIINNMNNGGKDGKE